MSEPAGSRDEVGAGVALEYIAAPLRPLALPIASLTPDAANARTHDEANIAAIAASLSRWGQRLPIVVQREGMIVRAGNGRVIAAKSLGWTHLAAVVVDESSVEATAFAIADNRTAELAGWNDETLAALLQSLPDDMRDVAGFDADDLGELLAGLTPEVVEDEAPEPLPDPVSKTGDLWELGDHRLLCGDSTDAESLDTLLAGQLIDLCVTSPPYNCDIEYLSHDDTMPEAEYLAFIRAIVVNAVSRLGKGRFIAWNVGVTPKSMHFQHAQALKDAGLQFWRQIVWAKAGVAFPIWQYTTAARKYHPNYTHEVIFLFSNGMPLAGGACDVDDVYSKDVWQIHQSSATRDIPGETNGRKPRNDEHGGAKAAAHPAAYPIGIPAGCIKHLTARAETVYEPFSGSGTTIIAAEQLGRKCYAIEIEPRYVDVAIRRWQKLTGKHATLNGKTWTDVAAERGVSIV